MDANSSNPLNDFEYLSGVIEKSLGKNRMELEEYQLYLELKITQKELQAAEERYKLLEAQR